MSNLPMPKRLLMAEQWDQFARQVLPSHCPAIQRQEMRRAFYAGAQAILYKLILTFAPDAEPTEADLHIMQDLDEELQAFAEAVQRGAA